MRTAYITVLAGLALLVASGARAELLHVEMKTLGMD